MNSVLNEYLTLSKSIEMSSDKKNGFLTCSCELITDYKYNIYLEKILYDLRYPYMMAMFSPSNHNTFVHFTSAKNIDSIIQNGLNLNNQSEYSDYYGYLCCFNIDGIGRIFSTPDIDTAIVFTYNKNYLSCIRQMDAYSNIGYCIIPENNLKDISIQHITTLEYFKKIKENSLMDIECISLHHGTDPGMLNKPYPKKFSEICDYSYTNYARIMNELNNTHK